MDIEQTSGAREPGAGGQIILPGEALPGIIHVIPQENRPFFPGQAIPLIMNADIWLPTLKSIQERNHDVVGIVATRRRLGQNVTPDDLYAMGTVCRIHRVHKVEDQLHLLLEGVQRFQVRGWVHDELPLLANVRYFPERQPLESRSAETQELKAYAVAIINTIKELVPLNPLYGEELKVFLSRSNPNEPSLLADFAASLTSASKEDLQGVLETVPLQPRLERALDLLNHEVQIARAQKDIREHVNEEIQKHQREAILRQQLKFIQKELGIAKDDKTAEIEKFRERIDALELPDAVRRRADEEMQKFSVLELGSPEYSVTRNYLDWLTSLPWSKYSNDTKDLAKARRVLDSRHDGLADVKERIVEFIGLGMMKGDISGSILLFVGPPGVGKTSLGRSIAQALGRKFYRFSVGGMRDEAEIKGHRRTYIGALPGKLIQALKDAGTANPVIMLDEVDKIGASYQGDPASALLEVLDPEQNDTFRDHYLDLDFDLSRVLFVCTANQLDTIPPPLLDRMDTIHLSGYIDSEKQAIARHHLWPRQLERAGLRKGDVKLEPAALRRVIEEYSREAGVRQLDKALGTLVRKCVLRILDGERKPLKVGSDDVEPMLGSPVYRKELRQHGVGIVTGLAWTPRGGATLPVEATVIHRRNAGFQITGQLGEVMKESANIAYSVVRSHAKLFGVPENYFDDAFVHLHVPAGATPKDGPSAGITMASALLSLARGKAVRRGVALTGELTLTGSVYPVGGIREKLVAAKRQQVKDVVLPAANRRDFDEVPAHVRRGLKPHFVERFDEVVALLFAK
jgi:ATP-dependent Lon protease